MRRALTIADAPALGAAARRATLLRTVLLAAIAILLAAAIALAGQSKAAASAPAVAAGGATTEVVLDVSGSVGDATYAFTKRTLIALSRGGNIGLIVFSDTAEEALPPGSPGRELLPVAHLFNPLSHRPVGSNPATAPRIALSPWYTSFSGGTRISSGLAAARKALTRDHAHGRVVLISDLGDASDDFKVLRTELIRLARLGIELRVLALPTTFRRDLNRFRRLEGPQVAHAALPPPRPAATPQPGAVLPIGLAVVAVLLALALAANELYGVSLRWQEAR